MPVRKALKTLKRAVGKNRPTAAVNFKGNKKGKGVRKHIDIGFRGTNKKISIPTRDVRAAEDSFPKVRRKYPFKQSRRSK